MNALRKAIEELAENESQWEAFKTDGHCVVLAPPGSGKTKLLTTKLASSLSSGRIHPPRGAACITMTNEAALELRRRLRGLGIHAAPNLFIGTVHSFALACVVGPFAAAAGMDDLASSALASNDEFTACFEAAYAKSSFAPEERGNIRATTERARQRLDLSGNLRLGGAKIAAFARSLQTEMEKRHVYDFQDLVRHAVGLVEDFEWVRRVLAATYPLIFVDEYQDLAPGLDRIVRALTLDSEFDTTLFAVGDPDQAIYAFSGARPQLLLELAAEPQVRTVWLKVNYRSGQQIIDIASRLTDSQSMTGQRSGGSVTVTPVRGGVETQAEEATRQVVALIEQGTELDQIAVLAPWTSDRDSCVLHLRDRGIPVFSRTDDDWRTTPATALLESLAAWSVVETRAGISLSEVLDTLRAVARLILDHSAIRAVVGILLDTDPDELASEFVERIIAAALEGVASSIRVNEDQIELSRMRAYLLKSSMTVRDLGARARAPGHVLASTIHAAKGLEFDAVVVLGADNAALYGFSPELEEVAEARRKFYVSITRARESVHIFYPNQRISQAGNTYPVRATPLLAELRL